MSIVSSICAEHHRGIVSNEISLLKQKVVDRHPDSDLTQGQVVTMLDQLEKTINSQIDE